ncbi:MAG: hypothetical protein U0470_03865 [Anaerolineae bacterium]
MLLAAGDEPASDGAPSDPVAETPTAAAADAGSDAAIAGAGTADTAASDAIDAAQADDPLAPGMRTPTKDPNLANNAGRRSSTASWRTPFS